MWKEFLSRQIDDRRRASDQDADQREKSRSSAELILGRDQISRSRKPGEKLYGDQKQPDGVAHPAPLSLTPASAKVAISPRSFAEAVRSCIASAAPVPS